MAPVRQAADQTAEIIIPNPALDKLKARCRKQNADPSKRKDEVRVAPQTRTSVTSPMIQPREVFT
jgi:hypothetical protein